MKLNKVLVAAITVAAAVFPVGSKADTISGGLHFSGDVTLTTDTNPASPTFGDGTLTFDPISGSAFDFTVDSGTGFFAGLTGDGNSNPFGAANAPINTTVNVPLLTFQNSPVTFTLTFVYPGVDPSAGCSPVVANEANGNLCTPPGTPFNLEDIAPNGTNSSAGFVVSGNLISGGTNNPATITYTASSTGKSFEQILHDQENGIPDVITYGAQLQTTAAEPATSYLMLGAGFLLAVGMFRRRRAR